MIVPVLGDRCVGYLLNRGPMGWEAYTRDDRPIGYFVTQAEAAAALLAAAEAAD
jgi:hypothetical protein